MSCIRKVMPNEERLLFVTRAHWIYLVQGLLWFGLMVFLGQLAEYYVVSYSQISLFKLEYGIGFIQFGEFNTPIPWVFSIAGFIIFWPSFTTYLSTELGLTRDSVIYKTGLMRVNILEVDLADISSEGIKHGWFGAFLGYGRIKLENKLFTSEIDLLSVRRPYEFLKAMHIAKEKYLNKDSQEKAN